MSRYDYEYEWDLEYCYPNSSVLKNKLNITDAGGRLSAALPQSLSDVIDRSLAAPDLDDPVLAGVVPERLGLDGRAPARRVERDRLVDVFEPRGGGNEIDADGVLSGVVKAFLLL